MLSVMWSGNWATVARRSFAATFVEVRDSFSNGFLSSSREGWRTRVNERSTRRKFGQRRMNGASALSLRNAWRSFRVRNFGSLKPSSAAVHAAVNLANAVSVCVQHEICCALCCTYSDGTNPARYPCHLQDLEIWAGQQYGSYLYWGGRCVAEVEHRELWTIFRHRITRLVCYLCTAPGSSST